MVRRAPRRQAGAMNDTDQQAPPPPPPPPPASSAAPPPGWHDDGHWRSDHLSDYRRLRRSHDDKKIGGVAAGVARHLDVDPTIVRVLFVVAIFFGGAGLLVYAALWLVVPDDTTGRSAHLGARHHPQRRGHLRARAGGDPRARRHHRRGVDLLAAAGRDRGHHAGVVDGPGPPRGAAVRHPARPCRSARPERPDVHPGADRAPTDRRGVVALSSSVPPSPSALSRSASSASSRPPGSPSSTAPTRRWPSSSWD